MIGGSEVLTTDKPNPILTNLEVKVLLEEKKKVRAGSERSESCPVHTLPSAAPFLYSKLNPTTRRFAPRPAPLPQADKEHTHQPHCNSPLQKRPTSTFDSKTLTYLKETVPNSKSPAKGVTGKGKTGSLNSEYWKSFSQDVESAILLLRSPPWSLEPHIALNLVNIRPTNAPLLLCVVEEAGDWEEGKVRELLEICKGIGKRQVGMEELQPKGRRGRGRSK